MFRRQTAKLVAAAVIAVGCVVVPTGDAPAGADVIVLPDTGAQTVIAPVPMVLGLPQIIDLPLTAPVAMSASSVRTPSYSGVPNPDAGVSLAQPPISAVTGLAPPAAGGFHAATVGYGGFDGLRESDAGSVAPADTNIASGPGQLVETTNAGFAFYDGSGNEVYKSGFPALLGSGSYFDPRVFYESQGGRFVMVVDDAGHRLKLAVSASSTAFSTWCVYTITNVAPSGGFADFPQIGSSDRFLYVTATDFTADETSVNDSRLWGVNRADAEACQPATTLRWTNLRDPGTGNLTRSDQLATQVAPSVYGLEGSPATSYLFDSYANGGAHVTVWSVDQQGALHGYQRSVPAYSPPTPAPQHGDYGYLDPGDSRITSAVNSRFGTYTAYASDYTYPDGTHRAVVEWLKFDGDFLAPNLFAYGGWGQSGAWYFYPSIAEGYDGTAMFDFSVAATNVFPSTGYVSMARDGTLGLAVYDYGTTHDNEFVTDEGLFRWGDFSGISIDANDPLRFWTANDYVTVAEQWSTRINHVGP